MKQTTNGDLKNGNKHKTLAIIIMPSTTERSLRSNPSTGTDLLIVEQLRLEH